MNFRKASIFQRDTEKPEEQNDSGGMLAVWGSPGSGKTITAVKIAKMLSARKKNVILLLCDMAAPMLPCICPADALESNGSLAGVLAAARISESLIKHNLVTFKRNSCLAVLGLLERQNEYSTPPFTQKQVVELLDGLRQIAPYIIVDCGSYIANDILSAVALMEADSILRLANCDPKSVNYFASQLPLLDGPEWDMDKQYKVASNVKPYQAADHIGRVLGDTAFVLPYSTIEAAASGNVDAINAVLKHYERYIAALATRTLYDENGVPHLCLDEEKVCRMRTKLITKILDFKVNKTA